MSLLLALVAAAIFFSAQRSLGPPVGDIACVLAAFTPVFVKFAPSLYWVAFLLLTPFAIVWCFGPLATTRARRGWLVLAVGLAVYLKSLCGYEYITTVILSPIAAAWFHQHRVGDRLRRKAAAAVALVGAGLAGFALAVATHATQIESVLHEDGLAAIRDRAAARTTGSTASEIPEAESGRSRSEFALACFSKYLFQRALSAPALLGGWAGSVPLLAVIVAAGLFILAAFVRRGGRLVEVGALAGALALALVAGVSWQLLAVNHMCVHRHLNLIVFAVPFLPVAFIAIGFTLRRAGRWLGTFFLLLVVAVAIGNIVLAFVHTRAQAEEQRACDAAVRERLSESNRIETPGVAGAVDHFGPALAVPPALLVEWGLFNADSDGPADPKGLVISGWALSKWRPTSRPAACVVVATGGSVLTARVQWFRRPDFDALVGQPMHRVGFVLAVPSDALKPGDRIRVFVVAATAPHRMTEITP